MFQLFFALTSFISMFVYIYNQLLVACGESSINGNIYNHLCWTFCPPRYSKHVNKTSLSYCVTLLSDKGCAMLNLSFGLWNFSCRFGVAAEKEFVCIFHAISKPYRKTKVNNVLQPYSAIFFPFSNIQAW